MTEVFDILVLNAAIQRAAKGLIEKTDYLTSLDQAMGDGDLGISMGKIGDALLAYTQNTQASDLGKHLAGAGMEANKAAPSTMGTLLATALMKAGKVIMGKTEFSAADVSEMLHAAFIGMQERGKANLGDKTILDSMHPADTALASALADGLSLKESAIKTLEAARQGRDSVVPLQSRIGRASWVGERTKGLQDPGCNAFVTILEALVGQ